MLEPAAPTSSPAPGRACGACTLCCKVYDVTELGKTAGTWCRHCAPGKGCSIYDGRPAQCEAFHCLWMTQSWLGPEWKPDRAKMVLSVDAATRFLFVQVDPGAPSAWRGEPYHRNLRQWATAALPQRRHVVVFLNRHATVILPDRDVAIGVLGPGDRIVTRERMTPQGMTLDIEKVAA